MKTLYASQTQHVSGGLLQSSLDKNLQATCKVESLTKTPSGTTAMTFSPSHPEGMLVRLNRFDANFTAPRDDDGEDQPLFPGLNDQGGI